MVETFDAGATGDHLYCLSGASPGPTASVIWSAQPPGGPSSSGGYGDECLFAAPDMTGDGQEDVLLGTAWGGRSAYVMNGMTGAVAYDFDTYADTPPSPATSGWVYTVKPVPDVDEDGVTDFFFACGSYNDGAYCISPGDGLVLWYHSIGDAVYSCSVLDDVNGDGRSDGAFGAGENADGVYVIAGGGGPTATVVWTRTLPGDCLATARIADIDGDGMNDVIAGTWSSSGAVYALSGVDGDVIWIAPVGSYSYVQEVVALDDVNGDGLQDVVVGAWDNRATVLSGLDGAILWSTLVGTLNGGDVWTVGRVGDVTCDGINDVVAGSFDYHVYLFDGATGDSVWWYNTGNRLYTVEGVSDITGNGWPEVIAGTQMLTAGPPGGRAYLIEGGDIPTGVAGTALSTSAAPSGPGIRVTLEGAREYAACHVERIRAGDEAARAASAFKRELFGAHETGAMTAADAMAARCLTPGPLWTRLTTEPIPILSGGASYLDTTAEPGRLYAYRFVLLTDEGDMLYAPAATARAEGTGGGIASPAFSLAACPNPVNPSTTIEFALPEAGPVRLAVYAANGRELARLLDERLPAGPARVEWDGRDSSGRALPSGLYFLRLEGKEFAETAKITVLR
jgi:hypothetical protein